MHRKKNDLVAQVCPATGQCNETVLNAAIQAQVDLNQAVSQTPIIAAISPNYVTASSGSLSVSGGIAMNLYDGSTYLSGGVTQSNPRSITVQPGIVGTLGWIWGAHDAASTNSFTNGDGNQAYISIPTPFNVNAFAAITHGYGGSTALELGIASPGKISYGFSPFSHAVPMNTPQK